jgi:EAL domain-containing protein (putative c-di-GMP-specific phosphodiesterase class I)
LVRGGALPETLRRVQDALSAPIVLGGREMQLRCSIGLSMYPQDGRDIEQLLRNADDAMYEAKEQGRGSYHFYSADLNARIARRLALEGGLRHALARGEFQVFYQPKVDLRTGQVSGAEALLRWTSPEYGAVSPAEFIPLAEENGLIEPIGAWVLATACEQLARWRAAGLPRITLSVNLSPRQLRSPTLVQDVSHLLRQCGVERGLLELEITETALMDDTEGTRTQIRDLRALDVRIAIDDFGTGYSALAYLQRFKADVLKIDRSFVQDVAHDEQAAAMVAAIIAMARSLGMSTLAEGVETEAQVTRLRALGCSEMQGWLFSPAIPADAMADLLATRRCLAVPGSIVT